MIPVLVVVHFDNWEIPMGLRHDGELGELFACDILHIAPLPRRGNHFLNLLLRRKATRARYV